MSRSVLSKQDFIKFGLSVAIVCGLMVAAYFIQKANQSSNHAVVDQQIITHASDAPDETLPDETDWRGEAQDPKRIVIPSIAVNGLIQKVGVDQKQQLAAPTNIHLGGWFSDGALPGSTGLSIIDGHVDSRSQTKAIFGDLANVQTESQIYIEFGDGSKKIFQIFKITETSAAEAPDILFSQDPKVKSQLNLITCAGNFNKEKRSYDRRLVVSAALIDS